MQNNNTQVTQIPRFFGNFWTSKYTPNAQEERKRSLERMGTEMSTRKKEGQEEEEY